MLGEPGSPVQDGGEVTVLVHVNARPWLNGLAYEARCGHGRTVRRFSARQVETTGGEHKQAVVLYEHRRDVGCRCVPREV